MVVVPLLLGDETQPGGLLGSRAQCRDEGGLLVPTGLPAAQGLQQVGGGNGALVCPEASCLQLQVTWPGAQLSFQRLPLLFLDQRGDGTGAVLVTYEGLEERGVWGVEVQILAWALRSVTLGEACRALKVVLVVVPWR